MACNMVLLTPVFGVQTNDNLWILAGIGGGLLLLTMWIGVFLVPLYIWRRNVRRRGYPGLKAYLRELPQTEEEKLDAVELTLKGAVICLVGVLIPPVLLIGLVPLYYGARKVAAGTLGIARDGDDGQVVRSA
jgi:hypothetical protein